MTPVFSVRHRAEEFNSLVEGSSTGAHERYADVLEVVTALRSAPGPEARPEFVSSLREQLMLAADTMLVPSDNARLALPVRTKPVRERRIAAAVGGLVIVGATTSMAMAAQSALPGDVLYPLKRAIENAEAGISVNDGQKGVTMLATASGRLDEVTALTSGAGSDDGTAIADTLNDFTEQATVAADLLLNDYAETGHETSIQELRDFTADSMTTLADLESAIPAVARDELLHAAGVLTQIDNEAAQACPSCGGVGISEIPAILQSQTSFPPQGDSQSESSGQQPGTGGKGQQDQQPAPVGTTTTPDETDDPLTSALDPTDDSQGTGGGQGGGDDEGDAISSLTEGLTGGGDSTPASNDGGIPGVPGSDEVTEGLEDVTDPLLDTEQDGTKKG